MGACLLSDVEKASSIIRHLATHLTIPVMAKIRILDTVADTIAFIQALQAAGCSAVTVHLRKRSVESTVPAANWEVMKEIVEGVRPFPGIPHDTNYILSNLIITHPFNNNIPIKNNTPSRHQPPPLKPAHNTLSQNYS